MNAAELNVRMLAVVKRLHEAEDEYERCIREAVLAEKRYKAFEAAAFLRVSGSNVAERHARAEQLDGGNLNDLRCAAHLADGLRDSAKQALRSRQSELSALQSEASLAKAEAQFLGVASQEVQTA